MMAQMPSLEYPAIECFSQAHSGIDAIRNVEQNSL